MLLFVPGPPSGALAWGWQVAVGQWGFSHDNWNLACACDIVGLWVSHVSNSSSLDELQFSWSYVCLWAFHGWVPQTGIFSFLLPFVKELSSCGVKLVSGSQDPFPWASPGTSEGPAQVCIKGNVPTGECSRLCQHHSLMPVN